MMFWMFALALLAVSALEVYFFHDMGASTAGVIGSLVASFLSIVITREDEKDAVIRLLTEKLGSQERG